MVKLYVNFVIILLIFAFGYLMVCPALISAKSDFLVLLGIIIGGIVIPVFGYYQLRKLLKEFISKLKNQKNEENF